jgi:hypothetical protein
MFQTKSVEKIKTHFISNNFSQKFYPYQIMWTNMVQSRQITDNNKIRRMHFASWITKASDTLRNAILYAFPWQHGYVNASQCYVTRTLPVLFTFTSK